MVASVNEVPVGLAWSVEWLVDRTTASIEEIAVVPQWHRHGVGRQLVYELAAWMDANGYQRLATQPITAEARRLFGRLGFTEDAYGSRWINIADLVASDS